MNTVCLAVSDWANKTAKQYIADIRAYIDNGWSHKDACNKVLDGSTLGSGWKAQIVYETKYYTKKEVMHD